MKERKKQHYSGFNRILQSEAVQILLNKIDDGTFSEFLDDWSWIFSYSKKYKWIILFYTVLGILSSSLSLGAAYISRILINIVVDREYENLWILIVSMIGTTAVSLIFNSLMSRISMRISIYVNNDIQAEIFNKIIDSQWMELNKFKNGDILNRFNSDVETISSNAISWIPNFIINIYVFVLTFLILFRMDITMAWISVISAPVLLVMSRYIMRKMREYRKRVLEMNSQMMSFEVETFYNFDMIKSFGIVDHYSEELHNWQNRYKEYNLDYNKFDIKSKIMMTIVSTIVAMIAFGYCLYRLWTGKILYGDMTFFLQQRSGLTNRFNSLVSTIPSMLNSAVSAHRIREIIELPREKHDLEAMVEMRKIADEGIILRMKNVTYAYKSGINVYENCDFEAFPGEIVAVLGSSGEGKTTLLRMILGLIYPDEGCVTLEGADGVEVSMNADLRCLFSYVPQGNTMIAGTIMENMKMVKEDVSEKEVIEVLKLACAWDFVQKLPDGLESTLGEKGKGVSEGQAQRLSIARALLRDSPILLLDEATSALDIKTEEKVLHNIMRKRPNKLVIVSTHRESVLKLCQRIYTIKDHKIEETMS